MQDRLITKTKMKRPDDPLVEATATPASLKRSKKGQNEDGTEKYDIDINCLDDDSENTGDMFSDESIFESINQSHLRIHECFCRNSTIDNSIVSAPSVSADHCIFEQDSSNDGEGACRGMSSSMIVEEGVHVPEEDSPVYQSNRMNYPDLLTFIEGSLVGSSDSVENAEQDSVETDKAPVQPNSGPAEVEFPSLQSIAQDGSHGKKLDEKQYIAYQTICCTFMLSVVYENSTIANTLASDSDLLGPPQTSGDNRKARNVVKRLKELGGNDHLIMLLSGGAGCRKSLVIGRAQKFCFEFCRAVGIPYHKNTIYLSSTSGSSAALIGGTTTHSAAYLNNTKIYDVYRVEWKHVRVFVVDEVSLFRVSDMVELNKKLQNLREDKNRPYGGVSVIFSGDFHQLAPVASSDSQILYSKSPKALWWVNLINCSIFLENNHRFKGDPEYGAFLERMRLGQTTSEDIDHFVNSRFIDGTNVTVPVDGQICHATANNKTRNAIASSIFREHIISTHPL
jgi:hypothetical protein